MIDTMWMEIGAVKLQKEQKSTINPSYMLSELLVQYIPCHVYGDSQSPYSLSLYGKEQLLCFCIQRCFSSFCILFI